MILTKYETMENSSTIVGLVRSTYFVIHQHTLQTCGWSSIYSANMCTKKKRGIWVMLGLCSIRFDDEISACLETQSVYFYIVMFREIYLISSIFLILTCEILLKLIDLLTNSTDYRCFLHQNELISGEEKRINGFRIQ